MKRVFFIVLLAISLSCEKYIPYDWNDSPENISGGNGSNNDAKSPADALLKSAVVFPEGYEWHNSGTAPECGCQLWFFKGDSLETTIDLPPGEMPGSDTHRILDGHLLHFTCADGICHIHRDGDELFVYTADEDLSDIALYDGMVHTLTTPKGEDGWVYRQNGLMKITSKSGRLLGGFCTNTSGVSFAFAEYVAIAGSNETQTHFYSVENGRQNRIPIDIDGTEIMSVLQTEKHTYHIGTFDPSRWILWYTDSKLMAAQKATVRCEMTDNFLVPTGDIPIAHTHILPLPQGSGYGYGILWSVDKELFRTRDGYGIRFCAVHNGVLGVCSSPRRQSRNLEVYLDGVSHELDGNLGMTSENAAVHDGKMFHIGLNDAEEFYRPLVISGKDTVRYDFNGYFTYLALQ